VLFRRLEATAPLEPRPVIFFRGWRELTYTNIAHNVPAVSKPLARHQGILAARIRTLRNKDQGRKNVGGVKRGNKPEANDLAERNLEPPTGPVVR
jgi:hypothetical protein